MLTKDFVASYENGLPIWILVFLLHCSHDKDQFSAWQLSAIAAGFVLLSLLMTAMGITSIQLSSELEISDITSIVVMFLGIVSIQASVLAVHIAVGLLAATCLRIFQSLFQWARRVGKAPY